MKKLIIALGAALLTLAACNKVETVPAATDLKLDLTVSYGTPGTKAVKEGWTSGDVIYVFFGKVSDYEEVAYLTLTYNGETWQEAWTEGLKEKIAATSSGKISALYGMEPLGAPVKYYYGSSSYSGPVFAFQDAPSTLYLLCEQANYTVSNGVLSADLVMKADKRLVQFYVPDVTWTRETVMDVNYGSMHGYGAPLFADDHFIDAFGANSPRGHALAGGAAFWGLIDNTLDVNMVMFWRDDDSYNLFVNPAKTLKQGDAIILPGLSEWHKNSN